MRFLFFLPICGVVEDIRLNLVRFSFILLNFGVVPIKMSNFYKWIKLYSLLEFCFKIMHSHA